MSAICEREKVFVYGSNFLQEAEFLQLPDGLVEDLLVLGRRLWVHLNSLGERRINSGEYVNNILRSRG